MGEGSTHGEKLRPLESLCPGEGSARGEWFLTKECLCPGVGSALGRGAQPLQLSTPRRG